MPCLDLVGDGEGRGHGAEGLAHVVHVEAGDDDAPAVFAFAKQERDNVVIEELQLVKHEDLRISHVGFDLRHGFDCVARKARAIVGAQVRVMVAAVAVVLERGDRVLRTQGSRPAADGFAGFFREHGAGHDFDPARNFRRHVIETRFRTEEHDSPWNRGILADFGRMKIVSRG